MCIRDRYKGLYYLVEHYFALPLPGHIQVSAPEEESESDESAEWSEEDGWGDESEWLDEEESGENQEEEQEE